MKIPEKAALRIFLADDDKDDRTLFSEALGELPITCEVVNFEDGIHLMAQLMISGTILPDIIFLDINMPLMDGVSCLKKIMENEILTAIPVVIYSTSYNKMEASNLERLGAARYLQKPNSFNQLKTLLYRCIAPFCNNDGSSQNGKQQFFVEI